MNHSDELAIGSPYAPPPRRSWARRFLNKMEVDRAVFFAVSQRAWQFLAGPITLVLIARYFTPEEQGYYYTFWGIVGLQAFFELAMPQTIITTASHQWRSLKLGPRMEIQGDSDALARLTHLTKMSLAIFCSSAIVFSLCVGVFGIWFFSAEDHSIGVNWRSPWIVLVMLSGLTFTTIPLLSVLEGCNRVSDVYQLQLLRSVLGNLAVWVAIPLGFGLWVPALAALVRLICESLFLIWRYRRFFASMRGLRSTARIDWRSEVWPFQSRILIKGMLYYLNADLMAPVIFHYHGAAWAGQLGMTLQILAAIRAACSSWVRARYSQMGMLVAAGEFSELDRVFFRVASIGSVVMLTASAIYYLAVVTLPLIGPDYAVRLLPPTPTAILLVGMNASLAVEFLWTYIHSHRVSPHLLLTIIGSLLSGLLIWWLGAMYDRIGVASAYCFVQAVLYLPLSIMAWANFRKRQDKSIVLQTNASNEA